MRSIFFDLETSDRDFIGQILNYAFLLVDEKFTILDECCGTVALTPLQVPSLGAILANRVKVLEHRGERTEREAVIHIDKFFERVVRDYGKVALVGYNSFRFDNQYLRTVMIRNGVNPYYSGNLVYRDLYSAVQFLACTDQRFTSPPATKKKGDSSADTDANGEAPKFSLSLENVSRHYGLLNEAQSHESRADVILEIALAEYINKNFQLHVANWDSYTARFAHKEPRGTVFHSLSPNRLIGGSNRTPMILIDATHKDSLWLDLTRYAEKKPALKWCKQNGGQLFLVRYEEQDIAERERIAELARAGATEFKDFTTAKYFNRESECDIEQDIYRIDMTGIALLNKALFFGDERGVREAKIKDLSALLVRAKLATGNDSIPGFTDMLTRYGRYRYGGGQMLLSRYKDDSPLRYAESREELLKQVAEPLSDSEDEILRQQLAEYYRQAPVLKF